MNLKQYKQLFALFSDESNVYELIKVFPYRDKNGNQLAMHFKHDSTGMNRFKDRLWVTLGKKRIKVSLKLKMALASEFLSVEKGGT